MVVATSPRTIDTLRAATRARHAALDAAVQLTDRGAYQRFLAGTFAAVSALEPALADALPALFTVDRTPALAADLAELEVVATPAPVVAPFASSSAALGAAYVLEGSALGGLVLAERVAAWTTATRYLRLRGKGTAARWTSFLPHLEHAADRDACCAAACATFDHFTDALRAHGALA